MHFYNKVIIMETRKLIAHGPSSLTVSLPNSWVRKNELKKGDVVFVKEIDDGLKITTMPTDRSKEININLIGHSEQEIIPILTLAYRRGFDEFRITYGSETEYKNISATIKNLIGLAIIENGKGICKVKTMAKDSDQDFKALFRRTFLILLQELEDMKNAVAKESDIYGFASRDNDVNSMVNLGIRLINKGYIQDRASELHMFYALLILEEIGDDLVKFSIEINKKKLKETEKACNETYNMLRMIYEAYFSDKYSLGDFYKSYYLFFPDKAPKNPPHVYDYFRKSMEKGIPLFYMRAIVEKTVSLAELLLLPK